MAGLHSVWLGTGTNHLQGTEKPLVCCSHSSSSCTALLQEKHPSPAYRLRGDINMLLLGDPGVAKSQVRAGAQALHILTSTVPCNGVFGTLCGLCKEEPQLFRTKLHVCPSTLAGHSNGCQGALVCKQLLFFQQKAL